MFIARRQINNCVKLHLFLQNLDESSLHLRKVAYNYDMLRHCKGV